MDTFTTQDLQLLFERQSGPCVSIYMPVHPREGDSEQDKIRLKNLLREAEERLRAQGLRTPEARRMLAPAEALLQDSLFWLRGGDGLAIFCAEEFFQRYRLGLPFSELLVVASRFHVKPLIPHVAGDGRFYILALSQKQVRLLEATRHTVAEIEPERTPPALAEALQYERYEKVLLFHTETGPGPGLRPPLYYGHDPDDEAKERLVRWFHKIDDELAAIRGDTHAPLVLAGVEYLFPLFREANTYPYLVEGGVPGNPEVLRPEELHAAAWPLVEPIFTADRQAAAERYAALAGTGRTGADVREVVPAASYGRVDTLFVPVDTQVWGLFDPETGTVEVHDAPDSADGDLLDLAALYTLEKSGTVYAVPPEEVPGGGQLAAIYRY